MLRARYLLGLAVMALLLGTQLSARSDNHIAEAAEQSGSDIGRSLRSKEATQRAEILFKNTLTEKIRVYWIDYQGKEVFYRELDPGQSYRQPTYVSHPWRIRAARDGRLVATLIADGKTTSATARTPGSHSSSGVRTDASQTPVIWVVAGVAWLGLVVVLRTRGTPLVFAAYLASLASFWIVFAYFAYWHGGDPMDAINKAIVATVWSPTTDPVLNFLIDACVVVVGVVLGVGVIASGLFLMVVLVVLLVPAWIASVSVTGALLVAAGAIAAGVFVFRRFRSWRRWASEGNIRGGYSSDYSVEPQGSVGGAEYRRPRRRTWPIGSWSEAKEMLFGGRYNQHYHSDSSKAGHSERRPGWFGGGYTQHFDTNYKTAGYSEEREGPLRGKYTQHFDTDYKKTGYSEEREGPLRGKYVQHFDNDSNKTGHTEKRSGFFGDYEVHYDKDGKRIEE